MNGRVAPALRSTVSANPHLPDCLVTIFSASIMVNSSVRQHVINIDSENDGVFAMNDSQSAMCDKLDSVTIPSSQNSRNLRSNKSAADSMLESFQLQLSKMNEEIKGLRKLVKLQEAKISELQNNQNNQNSSKLDSITREVDEGRSAIKMLQSTIESDSVERKSVSNAVKQIDNLRRADYAVVSHPSIANADVTGFSSKVQNLLSTTLDFSLKTLSDYFSIRPIGREGKRRALIRTFHPADRKELFTRVKRRKPAGLFINDNFSKQQEELFYQVRKFKRENRLAFPVFSKMGRVYFKKPNHQRPVEIKTVEDIAQMIDDIDISSSSPRATNHPTTDAPVTPHAPINRQRPSKNSSPNIPPTSVVTAAEVHNVASQPTPA